MDQRGVNVHGRRQCGGTRVTIDSESFKECGQTMRTLKNALVVIKQAQRRGYVAETLNHKNEEVEDREDQEDEYELDELDDRLLKDLRYVGFHNEKTYC